MKNLLIIYPHWPPSNLAGVHRPRLIANFLKEFGWNPIVLTVKEKYYEEPHDWNIIKTVAKNVEVIKTDAIPVIKIFNKRIIGDIGIRSFYSLYKAALGIIKERNINFIWIPIPSFYIALLGRLLFQQTNIPYGIDYIDPWVRPLASFEKPFSRAWWSLQVAKFLEPLAVKKVSLISGVSYAYYEPVLARNFSRPVVNVAMPYGFDSNDHNLKIKDLKLPWDNLNGSIKPYVYAGAFLPKSHIFIEALFTAVSQLYQDNQLPSGFKLFFIGTGNYLGKKIVDYAHEKGITHLVVEMRERLPFLTILNILGESSGNLIIGSIEKHYTASKTFQAILANKPIFSILHKESSALEVLKAANADKYSIAYSNEYTNEDLVNKIFVLFYKFVTSAKKWEPNFKALDSFSAKNSARLLSVALDKIV